MQKFYCDLMYVEVMTPKLVPAIKNTLGLTTGQVGGETYLCYSNMDDSVYVEECLPSNCETECTRKYSINYIFKIFLSDTFTCPTFGGHWYPCFGFLVMSPLGFKARVGSALFALEFFTNAFLIINN